MAFQLCRPAFYLGLIVILILNVVISLFTPVTIAFEYFYVTFTRCCAAFLMLCAITRAYPDVASRPLVMQVFAFATEAYFLVYTMVLSLRGMDQVSKVFAPAYADGWLVRADELLRLDWLAYFRFIHDTPSLHSVLIRAYSSLELASAVAVLGLLILKRKDRARLLVEGFIACAIISLVFGAIFPAEAAVATFVPDLSAYPNFTWAPGMYHHATLEALRDHTTPAVLGPGGMPGLVTFPSLHTANGILIVLVCWRTPLFWPALGYGAVMIPSTPIWGGHYFVDLIAGAILACAVVLLLTRQTGYAGIWTPVQLWRRGRTGLSRSPNELAPIS